MDKIKEITPEIALQIYNDIRSYYINKRYDYEQIFKDSGDYDNFDRDVLYDFVSPLLNLIDTEGSNAFEKFIKPNEDWKPND